MSEPLTIETATKFFFNATSVEKATNRMERKSLSKIGAFVRRRARSSMKAAGKSGKVSQPGEPPRTRRGDLKKFLYFVYEPQTHSVVVGPAAFARRRKTSPRPVPGLLESGGSMRFELVKLGGGLVVPAASKLAQRSGGQAFSRGVRMKPRPFMKPAFNAEMPNFPGAFEGTFNDSGALT